MGYTLEFLSVNITLGHPLCLVVEVPFDGTRSLNSLCELQNM